MKILWNIFKRRTEVSDQVGSEGMPVSIISQETDVMVVSDESKVWDGIVRWALYLLPLIISLWFLPITSAYVDANKVFLVSLVVLIAFIAWLARAIAVGSLTIPRSFLLGALGVWLAIQLAASIFSLEPSASLWGRDSFTFFSSAVFVLIALLTASVLRTREELARMRGFIFLAGVAVCAFEFVQLLVGFDVFPWGTTTERTFNLIGTWNSLGTFFGFLVMFALPFVADAQTRWARVAWGALAALALLLAVFVNFSAVWAGLILVSLVMLAYGATARSRKRLGFPLALLLLSVFLFLAQNSIANVIIPPRDQGGLFRGGLSVPLDILPNGQATMTVVKGVLRGSPILGFGPGTFEYAWDLFRDRAANDSAFWSLRFAAGTSYIATLIAGTGLLGAIGFIAILASFLLLAMRVLAAARYSDRKPEIVAEFSSELFLLVTLFLYPVSPSILMLTFLVMGLCIAEAVDLELVGTASLSVASETVRGFATALAVIFVMVLGAVGAYVTGQKYFASILFARGVDAFANEGSANTAERYFTRAASLDNQEDEYLRSLAQTSFVRLQRVLENANGRAPEDVRNDFQLALSNAIANARAATNINPVDALNWRLLGQIYEAVIPFATGSAESAVDAYKQAVGRSPVNPALRDDLARVYIALGNYVEARASLEEALHLKPDYASAHFRLAQIAALKGNIKEATRNTENAALNAPNDIGVLFQLGLLYYQQGRFSETRQVLERAVSLSPNYANALYFLGLSYVAEDDREQAVKQFSKIQELNPDNQEVRRILANLQSGKKALDGISPPGPAPERRSTLPLEEEKPVLGDDATSSEEGAAPRR